ncbi:MAG: GNAT family N-acetyltransferase [Spirochaetia bacterium]
MRKLGNDDKQAVLDLVSTEPEYTIFIHGDIANYGMETEFMELWGRFDNTRLESVLLRYYSSWSYYGLPHADPGIYADILKNAESVSIVSGKRIDMEELAKSVPTKKLRHTIILSLPPEDFTAQGVHHTPEPAAPEDAEALLELHSTISEFADSKITAQQLRRDIESKAGRCFVIRGKNTLLSAASSTAENPGSAMIVGVMTRPEHRNKGYASACVQTLCAELSKEGKRACLFFDNPEAGKMYTKYGFQETGFWSMLVPDF